MKHTDFPALDGRPVTQAHADICEREGHATHTVDGVEQGTCPRCGEVTTVANFPGYERVADIPDNEPIGDASTYTLRAIVKALGITDLDEQDDYATFALASALETLLWSETVTMPGAAEDAEPEPADEHFDTFDLKAGTVRALAEQLTGFVVTLWPIVKRYQAHSVGHDFVLTMNETGAGFGDGDYTQRSGDGDALTHAATPREPWRNVPGPDSDALAHAARPSGPFQLYVGDDGTLYHEG